MDNQLHDCGRIEQDPGGVFPHLADSSAFLDKVSVQVWGKRRKRQAENLEVQASRPIGGPGRFYARALPGLHVLSGNHFQLRYGKLRQYGNLAPFSLTIWSDGSPVTCAETFLILDGLMRFGYKGLVSAVELTFDVHEIPVWRFARELVTRAHIQEIPVHGPLATLNVGSSKSPWSLTIYRKTDNITRVEFKLRSTFLRGMGIGRVEDLYALRQAALWKSASFRQVDQTHGHDLPPRVKGPWDNNELGLPPMMPAAIIQHALRASHIAPQKWIVRSAREKLLRNMQGKLLW